MKFCCLCGCRMTFNTDYELYAFEVYPAAPLLNLMYPEKKYDEQYYIDAELFLETSVASGLMMICPQCGRYWLPDTDMRRNLYHLYVPDPIHPEPKILNNTQLPYKENIIKLKCLCGCVMIIENGYESFHFKILASETRYNILNYEECIHGIDYLNGDLLKKSYLEARTMLICPQCDRRWISTIRKDGFAYYDAYTRAVEGVDNLV